MPPAPAKTVPRIVNPKNPTGVALYSPTLPIEFALQTAPMDKILEAYNLTWEEWEIIRKSPAFVADLTNVMEALKKDGMSFRMKARLQAEALLDTNWELIHDADTPAQIKQRAIASVWSAAGFDSKEQQQQGPALTINLQLG